jgi:outer membrane protein assembly factor BamB
MKINMFRILVIMLLQSFWANALPAQTRITTLQGEGFVVQTSATGEADRVYVGSYDTIFCLDARAGKIVWSHKTPYGTVDVGPIMASGVLVYAGGGGHFTIYGLDPETGRQEWEVQHRTSLLIAGDGMVFANTQFGNGVVTFEAGTGKLKWTYDKAGSGSLDRLHYYRGSVYTTDYVLAASVGRVLWQLPSSARAFSAGDDEIFIFDENLSLAAVPPDSRAPIWQDRVGKDMEVAGLASSGRRVFAVVYDGYPGSAKNGTVYAYNAQNGTPLWNRHLATSGGFLSWDPIRSDAENVYLLVPGATTNQSILECWRAASGTTIWTYKNDAGLIGPVAIVSQEVYANDDVGHIYVVDSNSGRLLRTLSYPSPHPAKH